MSSESSKAPCGPREPLRANTDKHPASLLDTLVSVILARRERGLPLPAAVQGGGGCYQARLAPVFPRKAILTTTNAISSRGVLQLGVPPCRGSRAVCAASPSPRATNKSSPTPPHGHQAPVLPTKFPLFAVYISLAKRNCSNSVLPVQPAVISGGSRHGADAGLCSSPWHRSASDSENSYRKDSQRSVHGNASRTLLHREWHSGEQAPLSRGRSAGPSNSDCVACAPESGVACLPRCYLSKLGQKCVGCGGAGSGALNLSRCCTRAAEGFKPAPVLWPPSAR